MIVVDTSALIAILKGELESDACIAALTGEPLVLISGGTMAGRLLSLRAVAFAEKWKRSSSSSGARS